MNHVKSVTLIIETANGEMHKLVVHEPPPTGGNPRFMAQQVEAAVTELARRADDTMATYGQQIGRLG